jgi:hypothetical protein
VSHILSCHNYRHAPSQVDPDRWLATVDGQAFARKIDAHGCVKVDLQTYYIQQQLSGQHVVLFVNVQNRAFDVWSGSQPIKRVPIKGLQGEIMPFDRYVDLMREEARAFAVARKPERSNAATTPLVGVSEASVGKFKRGDKGKRCKELALVH